MTRNRTPIDELSLSRLEKGDRIFIRTRTSMYRLSVVDSESHIVSISGGKLDRPRQALVIGNADPVNGVAERVRRGQPLVYSFVESADPRLARTSPVVAIELRRDQSVSGCFGI